MNTSARFRDFHVIDDAVAGIGGADAIQVPRSPNRLAGWIELIGSPQILHFAVYITSGTVLDQRWACAHRSRTVFR